MTGIEFGAAAVGKAAVSTLNPLGKLFHRWTWKRRLAGAAAETLPVKKFTRRARQIRRLVREALGEQSVVDSLRRRDQHAVETTCALLKPHLRDSLKADYGAEWESHLYGISGALRDHYFDDLEPPKAIRLVDEGNRLDGTDTSRGSQALLSPVATASLEEMSERGEARVAASLRVWMSDPANRRSDKIAEFIANPSPLMADGSYLAWETFGHYVSEYNLGNPFAAYEMAIHRMSPREMLYRVGEALRRFNGSNFADADQILDPLPQDHALVRVARAVVEDDMALVVDLLEQGGVCESEDPAIARFGKRTRIAALMQNGNLDEAIDLARQAMQEYPSRAFWKEFCGHLLALAAQNEKTNGARRRHLAEEGIGLALEARDMIRQWNGPSGSAVGVAIACQFLLRDLQAVCRLATLPPEGEATDAEAEHPEVIVYLARAYGMLERFDAMRELDTSGLSEFDCIMIKAWLARHENDPEAINLMRTASALAEGEVERSTARYGLAFLGRTEDITADAGLQEEPSEAALLASLASLEQGDPAGALAAIRPYMWDSTMHAAQYAYVLVEQGDLDAAVAHLDAAANRFTAPELLHCAAAYLLEASRHDDAEPLAVTVLTRATEEILRKFSHGQLIEIANRQHSWSKMLQCAEAAAAEFSDETQFHWAAIVALCKQGELERAYRYLQEHRVEAVDRQSLLIEIQLRAKCDRSLRTIDWLLNLAEDNTSDEEALAAILISIFEASQEIELGEERPLRLNALVGGFLQAFPSSDFFRVIEAPDIEPLIAEMRATLEPGSIQRAETAEKVSLGQLPFGMLQAAYRVPYALLLVEGAAGALNAVALDEGIRRQEREAATEALNNAVVIDTSSIMLWQQHLGGSPTITRCFSEILVPSELLVDLKTAKYALRTTTLGTMDFSPAAGRMLVSKTDPEQVRATQDAITNILFSADRWTHIESTSLTTPDSEDVPSQLAPWDAAVRVALDRGCALWIDDAIVRAMARHYGIPAFGTYALYEALMEASIEADLPPSLEFKRSLLKSRVADVPLTWGELDVIANQDGLGVARFILERPSIWNNPQGTFRWFRKELIRLRNDGGADDAPYLLYASTVGACRAADRNGIPSVAGALLTAALLVGLRHELVPALVAAARAACRKLTLNEEVDPLPVAASNLVREANKNLPHLEGGLLGGYVTGIFSGLDDEDRQLVSTAILGAQSRG